MITQACIDRCGLAPTGMVQVEGVHGVQEVETFLVNILLPNMVRAVGVTVTRGQMQGADILIGMDIISKGDFSVTNANGVTKFSYRTPSIEHIDYSEQATAINAARNQPPGRAARRRAQFGR